MQDDVLIIKCSECNLSSVTADENGLTITTRHNGKKHTNKISWLGLETIRREIEKTLLAKLRK